MRLTSIKTSIISIIGLSLMLAFGNLGCNKDKAAITEVVKKYFVGLEKLDTTSIETIDETGENSGLLGLFTSLSSNEKTIYKNLDTSKKMYAEDGGFAKIEKIEIDPKTHQATVTVKMKKGYPRILTMIQAQQGEYAGKWLVMI